jgi:hypothetical protein
MKSTIGISHRLKRAWLDDVLDRLVQTKDEKEMRAFVDQRLRDELPGKDARAKATGIILRIWSGIDQKHFPLRDRAVSLLPTISGQERIWLHWGMTALAYPFFRDLAEVIGRMLTLQDDFTTAQAQARLKTAWGDRETSKEAAGKLITSMVDWEVLRATKVKGHFLLARKMTTTVADLQLWLIEAMLSARASEEIEAQQLLRLPESFPFTFTIGVGDLRKHESFDIHRQGLDTDMVAVRQIKIEAPVKLKKPKKKALVRPSQPTFFDEPKSESGAIAIPPFDASMNEGTKLRPNLSAAEQPLPQVLDLPSMAEPQPGYRVLVLVRNLKSAADAIDFGEFVLTKITTPHLLSETFAPQAVYGDDWQLAKAYPEFQSPDDAVPVSVGGILKNVEEILLLLRLFAVGDIAFVRIAVTQPDGSRLVQFPYRLVNDLNKNSLLPTELNIQDGHSWLPFATGLRASQSWRSEWFSIAARFFLYGGAKEFNPAWNEIDRVVDYATALEATLVPEGTFSRSRCAERAARLCSSSFDEQNTIVSLLKKLYDIRSSIVHGNLLSFKHKDWLEQNRGEIERRVRQVLIVAVQQEPSDENGRKSFLRALFDVTDIKRGEYALQVFKEIETQEVRNSTAAEIERLSSKSRDPQSMQTAHLAASSKSSRS